MSSSEATSSSTHRATPSTPNIPEPGTLTSNDSPTQPPGDGFVFDVFPPEIQTEIFSYLVDDHKTLVLAALVSKVWYACFINLLWRDADKAWLDRLSSDRQQYYADKICSLRIRLEMPLPSVMLPSYRYESLFHAPTFPLLKWLRIVNRYGRLIRLQPYLSPRLCLLHLDECYFDMNTFDMVALCCTHLQTLELICCRLSFGISDNPVDYFLHIFRCLRHLQIHDAEGIYGQDAIIGPGCTTDPRLETLSILDTYGMHAVHSLYRSEWVNNFILRCITLRRFEFEPGHPQSAISAEALARLSTSALKVLRLDQWIERGFVEECLQMPCGANRFRNIRRLSLRGEASAIISLMPDAPNTLVELDLLVDDSIQNILQTIGRFSMLKILSLSFYPDRQISVADLSTFSTLSKLRKLCIVKAENKMRKHNIYSKNSHLLDVTWLTDHDFEQWISNFSLLCDLHLGFDCPAITGLSIKALANSCPLLKSCELWWKHDPREWKFLDGLSFPNLETLYFGDLEGLYPSEARKCADMLKNLAPGLKRFRVRKHDGGIHPVEDRFRTQYIDPIG